MLSACAGNINFFYRQRKIKEREYETNYFCKSGNGRAGGPLMMAPAGCPHGGEAGASGAPSVSLEGLVNRIAGLLPNSAVNPHTVRLAPVNITAGGVMAAVNQAVTGRYIILDLSACYAADNTISGDICPGPNDMNGIQRNPYVVGVILPGGLTSIGYGAFFGCASLVSITVPGSVTSIWGSAFERCSSLAGVTIPGGVTSIG